MILIAFQNQGPVGTTPQDWAEKVFGQTNSVRDYYREVSYGQLDLVPATESHGTENDGIVGWLTLDQDHPNMGGNLGSATEDLAKAALTAADEFVDFASFDKNADGAISSDELHIIIVAAGYDTAYGGETSCSPSLWAHQTSFLLAVPTFDGVQLGDAMRGGGYIEMGEWHCDEEDTPGHAATLGVMVHEFGHDLGRSAPDLYDSDGSSYGIGNWDVMAHGAWNKTDLPGDTPAHFSAWVKAFFGWLTPHVITTGERQLTLNPAEQAPDVWQLLSNPNGIEWNWGDSPAVGEYFLIENRQKLGYDSALPGAGLLIWYIDESQFNNDDESRRLVDLIEADGQNNLKCRGQPQCNKGDLGDPFPGAANNQAFTKDTTPSSNFRNGFPSGVELTQIALGSPTVQARVRVGAVNNGNIVLFADAFDGPEDGWWPEAPWSVQPATQCQSGSSLASGNVWYHGTSECQYSQAGTLLSPTISIPPGTVYLRIKFSTMIQLRRGDRAEIRAHFNDGRERVVYRRSVTRGWIAVEKRLRIPNGVSEMYLEFFVREGRSRRTSAPPLGWWLDNLEVRTEPTRTQRSSETVIAAPEREEPRSVIETRLQQDGTLVVLAQRPAQEIQLWVYDLSGRLVAAERALGSELRFRGLSRDGQRLARGVYLYIVTLYGRDGSVWRSEVRKLIVR
ncbi:MAG: M6 family metalloprotease domain-containing protein [Candidatus Caldarchaeum sp.]